MIDLSECTLEPLHGDGELVLYRVVHARAAKDVRPRMLLLAPARDDASPATLAGLEHEYSLAAELDPRWAVRPVAIGRHHGRTVLVLEDPGGVPLARLLSQPMEVRPFLQLAISLAHAVGSVHAAGLIHKDIKPAHVLVNSETSTVWLTGFGIA
jgi:serine/threonine protein kinase